jgi:hypothetical protein
MGRPGGCGGATLAAPVSRPSRPRKPTRSPGRPPTVPPTANELPATSSSSTRPTRKPTPTWQTGGASCCACRPGASAPTPARSSWSGPGGRGSWANDRPASRVAARGIGRLGRRWSTGSAGRSLMPSARSDPSRTARTPRLNNGRPAATPTAPLVACATWPATATTDPSGRRRLVAATIGPTAGDHATATTTSATSAPCSRMVARPPRPQTTTSERPPRASTASHGPRSPAPRGRARRRFARVG